MTQAVMKRKTVTFLGKTLRVFRGLPPEVKHQLGGKVAAVQMGMLPEDCKSISRIGSGAMEIRAWSDDGTYRVIYVAKFNDAVYILHVFKKTTKTTSKKDVDVAKVNYGKIP